MNPTLRAVHKLLETLWKAADEDTNMHIDNDDQDAAHDSIVRQETIADIIDMLKEMSK